VVAWEALESRGAAWGGCGYAWHDRGSSSENNRVCLKDDIVLRRRYREREVKFIEDDVTRDEDSTSREVQTPVPLIIRGLPKEGTTSRSRRKLVRGGGIKIRIASTPEHVKMIIGGIYAKKSKVGVGLGNCLGGEAVEQIGSSGQPLGLVAGKKGGLEQQGAHDVVHVVNSLAILRRSIGARHPQLSVVGEEEGTGHGVVKLLPVVTLDSSDSASKLSGKGGERIRLQVQGKSPQVIWVVIQNEQITFIARNAEYRGCPERRKKMEVWHVYLTDIHDTNDRKNHN
jgi:hypothetical protein